MTHLIEIDEIIANAGSLMTLPDICLQVKRVAADPESSITDLAELISKDPALTARLLKMVNSSLYYFPREIASVSEAIGFIGTSQLYNLALATSAASIIKTVGGSYIELKTLWKKAVYSAVFATILHPDKEQDIETRFVIGLLSNIGALAIVEYSPDIALTAIGRPNKGQYYWQREEEVLGFTVAEASGGILQSWNLPGKVVDPVRFQHLPDSERPYYLDCCILHVAARIAAEVVDKEVGQIVDYRKTILKEPLARLGLSHEDLDGKIGEVHTIAPELLNLFII